MHACERLQGFIYVEYILYVALLNVYIHGFVTHSVIVTSNCKQWLLIRVSVISAYAIAELIDNALAATAENVGPRNIEIRLVSYF